MSHHESGYTSIVPAGGDTATPLNLAKRLEFLERQVGVRGKKFIDCGCGAGEYVLALRRVGADAYGIEYSESKVGDARQAGAGPDLVWQGDIANTDCPTNAFDVALLNEVLEHVPDEALALREVHRILKPGGTLVVFSPNRLYPFETHGVYLRSSGARVPHYLPFVPYVPLALGRRFLHYWARNYWPGELSKLVRAAGFRVLETKYVWQTFENISRRQPALISFLRPALRKVASIAERVPVLRALGVSQVVIARKID